MSNLAEANSNRIVNYLLQTSMPSLSENTLLKGIKGDVGSKTIYP
jgi:hypothetical protein